MRRGLTSRLKRLEAKRHNRTCKRLVIFTVDADEAPGELVGLTDLRTTVARLWTDSDFGAFAYRASAALGHARIMCARYAPRTAPEPPPAPLAAPTANPAPVEAARVMDYYRAGWLGARC
jgi:hypothetical protein